MDRASSWVSKVQANGAPCWCDKGEFLYYLVQLSWVVLGEASLFVLLVNFMHQKVIFFTVSHYFQRCNFLSKTFCILE
jgi:hypothetical protein